MRKNRGMQKDNKARNFLGNAASCVRMPRGEKGLIEIEKPWFHQFVLFGNKNVSFLGVRYFAGSFLRIRSRQIVQIVSDVVAVATLRELFHNARGMW